mgnify:CR=1 FL=1
MVDGRGSPLVAPVHQVHLAADAREVDDVGRRRVAAAHDHHVGGHVLKLLSRSALHRALEGLGVAARLLDAVRHSRQNGVGGVGRARNRIHRQRLVLNDRSGNPLDRRFADARGLCVLRYAHGRDGILVKIHLNRHGAVVAVGAGRVGPGGVALSHGRHSQAQRHYQAQ